MLHYDDSFIGGASPVLGRSRLKLQVVTNKHGIYRLGFSQLFLKQLDIRIAVFFLSKPFPQIWVIIVAFDVQQPSSGSACASPGTFV